MIFQANTRHLFHSKTLLLCCYVTLQFEYVEGRDLLEVLNAAGGPLSEAAAAFYFAQARAQMAQQP
jgi:hypothetical protein